MSPGEGTASEASCPGSTPRPGSEAVRGLVSAIRRLAIHDGPGIRTLVFLKGCPLRCAWCAAPETQASHTEILVYPERCLACDRCREVCPEGAILVAPEGKRGIDRSRCTRCGECVTECPAGALRMCGEEKTVGQVVAEVERDRVFYQHSGGGVTISGGEPLAQAEFTQALFRALRARGLHTAMETSGLQSWDPFEKTLADLDLLLYDLKLMDPEQHERFTGASNELILENLRRVMACGVPTIVRVPVVPGINDGEENCRAMSRFLRGLGSVRRVDLLPYHRLGEAMYARLGREYGLTGIPLASESQLERWASLLKGAGLAVQIGG